MKKILLFGVLVFLGFNLNANPALLQTMKMRVLEATYAFEDLSEVSLTLTSTDGETPTGMLLKYGNKLVLLDIKSSNSDSCGCLHYAARLPDQEANGVRFSISLVDHSASSCSHDVGNAWTATVRSGFGWCGTGDSTMTLSSVLY